MSAIAPLLFELIERICTLNRSELRSHAGAERLHPVHLLALGFLDRANRYSNTPQSLAEYLGSTKGTVSQSLFLLYRRALIERETDPDDRRIVRLRLSEKGKRLVERLMIEQRTQSAVDGLPDGQLDTTAHVLEQILANLQRARGGRSFGICRSCRHFLRQDRNEFRCGLTGEPLSVVDSAKICREHEPPN